MIDPALANCAAMARLGLTPGPVPAGDLVPGRHQPGHDQRAHGAKADKSDVQ
jgi:hypothetical protein